MRRKNFITFIILIILILISLDLIKGYGSIPTFINVGDSSINIESYIEYGDHSVLAVHYPIFGLNNIDNIIRNLVFDYVNNYKNSIHDISLLDTNYKAELHIDYEIYHAPGNIVSIKFIILENLNSGVLDPQFFVETLVLDLTYDRQISLIDTLKENFVQVYKEYKYKALTTFNGNDQGSIGEEKTIARKINNDKPMVALTFDDGPYKRATIPILDTLKEHNTVATFFILGNRIPNHQSIVKRIHDEGSEIGNHTYNHKQLTTLTSNELKQQINKTQKMILEVVGSEPKVMRPTYGSYNNNLRAKVNMPMILWSIDPMDWKTQDAEKISEHILSRVKDGDIILMHDIFPSTAEAVDIIIPELLNRGFQLVTVSELYEAKGRALEVGKIYRHVKQN